MSNKKPNVILISVDALKPEFVFEQERLGISLPNLTKHFCQGGSFAGGGVKSVFPTFTYPCHQSIITGTTPKTHGIYNNIVFDPTGEHKGAWHWFASDRVLTLWEAASKNGYLSASAAFPTSVGAKGDYIAPEFWWDGTAMDSSFIDAMSTPQGLVLEMEREIGRYAGGLDLTDEGDAQRHKAAVWLLEKKLVPRLSEKPFFLSGYYASFDESAHLHGVYSREAAESLVKIDTMLGAIYERANRATDGNVVICVVSDHGTLDNQYNICPNVLLRQAGLITTDEKGQVTNWRAWSQRAGGIAEVRVRDREDDEAHRLIWDIARKLADDPDGGILEALDKAQAIARGGFPLADCVLVARKGYEIRDDITGAYLRDQLSQQAQHGYSEEFPEMRASFLIAGPGIAAKRDLGALELIDIAPTLAAVMGFSLPQAEGVNRLA